MSKGIKFMISILTFTLLFSGCSNRVEKVEKNNEDLKTKQEITDSDVGRNESTEIEGDEKESISGEGNLNESSENIADEEQVSSQDKYEDINDEDQKIYSNKQIYLEKLDELEVELKTKLKEKYDSGVTQQMLEASNEEFEAWDNMLNEIYSKIKVELTEEKVNTLIDEQLNWIDIRDEKSESADDGFEDGTIAPLKRIMSLITSTKDRCYELVNKYM